MSGLRTGAAWLAAWTAVLQLTAPTAARGSSAERLPPPTYQTVRGVILSTHTDGQDWASDGAMASLRDIHELGAGWVAIHPYAGIADDGDVRFWDLDPGNPPEWLMRPIHEAHALGLKILIVPHLAHWGSRFHWRGEIGFDDSEQWNRFWTGYTAWIVGLARICRDADGFCVGSELDRTLQHEERWRALIAQVRDASPAALTYAANWTDFERVPFWDALDVIGIQAYFPLLSAGAIPQGGERGDSDSLATVDQATLQNALHDGWRAVLDRLRPYALAHDRPIVFTELGYNRAWNAPVTPWTYQVDGPEAERIQVACMTAALDAIADEPWVLGAFLWKWFPQPRDVGRNFQLATPAMRRAIAHAWNTPPAGPAQSDRGSPQAH